ncbi:MULTISPECIES: metal-dependent transcriptional regulator [Ruminococcus]|uniref:Iron (Metal) dependent repressor, DtxR family n=1 Tax=Ruminococcus flavefaciens TaxID=1265 RepID=A0A1M7GKD4_RUMFL|nr:MULTISPECIES: metal-dependent transcriptional regulator [Ruminococcus]MCR4795901.1 metal-dependent transcriptional regulator [Ruminococcus sp.]SHM16578.1 iron (metal) dependent repressor, DtxR family [Ruminococcus flavefaciens]
MKQCAGYVKYLVAIKELSEADEYVRCVNISKHLGVSRPSVSKMLRCLANSGYVYEDYCNSVVLTPEGEKAVEEIFSTFNEVNTFFHKFLKLSKEESHEQAIKFITDFPQDTCERLRKVVRRTLKKKDA